MAAATRIISIVGPESTGKSTLAKKLGQLFSAPVIPEFARDFLEKGNGKYVESDLVQIANGQFKLEKAELDRSSALIVCDTDVLVIKVWQEFKFGRPNAEIDQLLNLQKDRTHLLTYPDLDWVPDPLRENPNDLKDIFNMYVGALESIKANYFVVKGKGEERLKNALNLL